MEGSDPTEAPRRRRPSRAALIVIAGLIPLVPIVIGAFLIASSATGAAPAAAMHPLAAISTSTTSTLASKPVFHPAGAEVALVTTATELHTAPNGPVLAPQPVKTTFGSPTVLLVRQTVGPWLGVLSPLAGNGRLGWLPAADATISYVNWKIEVSLGRRTASVFHGKRLVEQYKIAIGRPTAPTPTGTFAVTDRLSTGDPEGPYGCCILALSALAPHAIQDWDGGDRIAIHSTPPDTYSTIGDPVSHGCMHVTLPEGQWLIDHVPLGTPTIIRSD